VDRYEQLLRRQQEPSTGWRIRHAMQITKDQSGVVLNIAGTLDISVAEELRDALVEFIEASSKPVVDLSGVDGCDTAALQLLCSAQKTAERCNKLFEVAAVSTAIENASAILGLPLLDNPAKGGSGDAI
jgi:anti-anti-sigma factor